MHRSPVVLLASLLVAGGMCSTAPPAAAAPQSTPSPPDSTAPARPAESDDDDDMVLDPAQPEFTVVNLPTTLALPRHRVAFRVTHRFTRDLTAGDFGDLLADFFGFDGGALIGLDVRFGVARGWQAGVYRTSDRTIQLFTQYEILRQRGGSPIGVDLLASVEGTNNFDGDDPRQPTGDGQRSPAFGAIVSRVLGSRASVNATVAWVGNTNPLPGGGADDDDTVVAGVGARLRISRTVYVVGEIVPRVAGYRPGTTLASFGLEKRVGGHAFQVNVSNGFGSTVAQMARGGVEDAWFIGFNINRKFF